MTGKENILFAAATLFQRLLLTVYAYGTNTGIRAVAAGEHGHGEDELRYVRRRYITVESCRQAARVIANATFAARQAWLWGEGSTASRWPPAAATSTSARCCSSPGRPARGAGKTSRHALC